ncbi:MAG: nuclear transport factor 2 family protein [Chitinophagaceae bacterium]
MSTKEEVMTTQEVANRFNELAQTGKWDTIQNELFADNAVSIEPAHAAAMGMGNAEGIDAIKKKGDAFGQMVEEMHGGYSNEPQIAGNHFAVAMGMDVTMKGAGRVKMDEIAVYGVKDGKIIKEQFFY